MRKVFKFGRKVFKFTAIFFFIAVFGFSNFISFLPQSLQNNKFAESLKVKEAMAVADTVISTGNWTAPTGVTSVSVEVWGAGGGGGRQNLASDGGGGGGGGAYSKLNTYTVVPGNNYAVTIGAGGGGGASAGSCGGTGGDSYFVSTATVMAKGGVGGCNSTGTPPAGGLGGASASGVGDVKWSGGQGEKGKDNATGLGGYGGSSAGTAAVGYSGPQTYSTNIYPTASTPAGGGHGGDGGAANAAGSAPVAGQYGGGGGGSGETTTLLGGVGAGGKVIITYTRTTLSNFVTAEPSNSTIAPGASGQVDSFGLATDVGTDTVTGATVTLATGMGTYIQTVAITNDGDTVTYCSATPSGDTATLTSCGIPVSTTNTQFKIKLTAKSHSLMPAPAGGLYAVTGRITAFTNGSAQTGTDSGSATVTIDNASPAGTTGAGATSAENAQSTVSWTNPGDADFQQVYVYCKTSSMISGEAPAEGGDPAVDATACDATARMKYKGTASPQVITGLTNGTPYYFRIYARDTNGNFTAYSATQEVTGTPSAVAPNATSYLNNSENGLDNLGARNGQINIVISGTNFGADPGAANRSTAANNVKIGSYQLVTGDVTAWSATSITIQIPSGQTSTYGANLTVTAGSQSDATPLTFKIYPDITSISPSGAGEAKEGDTITITGTRFGATQGTNKVLIDGVAATITGWTDTSINATVPSAINDANNSVTVRAYQGTEGDNTLYDESANFIILPKITFLTVPTAEPNAAREYLASDSDGLITVNGNHFGIPNGTNPLTILGINTSGYVSWTDTAITSVQIPTGISDSSYTGNIVLTRNDSKSHTYSGFRVLPRITGLVPSSGGNGTPTTINGDHLCQQTTCDAAAVYNAVNDDGNDVKWGTTANATVTATGHTSFTANAPSLSDGAYAVTITSLTYVGNNDKNFTIANDTTPPTPNPMTFSSAPNNTSATQIDMTASTATDATTPPVSYYFALDTTSCTGANIGTGAADSGWQSGTTYSDTGLSVNKCYGYKVKARDSVATPNETGYSGITILYTSANVPSAPTVGSPTSNSLVITNNENGNPASNPTTYFAVQVTTADGNWNGKWVDGSGNASASEVWLTDVNLTSLTVNGLTAGTQYDFQVKARNNDGDQTSLGAVGSGTTSAPPQVTADSSGTQITNIDAGDTTTKYLGAAFRFQQNSGTADTITALTISETGSVNANANLSANAGIRYESGVASCTYNGTETLVSDTFDVTTDKMTLSGLSIPVTVGSNFTCVYVVFDVSSSAVGGQTIDLEITGSGDFTLSGGTTKAGTYPVQLTGSTVIRPNITSISVNEAREGDTITIYGVGFGTAVGSATIQIGSDSITTDSVNNTVATGTIQSAFPDTNNGGTGASGLLITVGGIADDARQTFYILPKITFLTVPTAEPNAAREYLASDSDGLITVNGNHFGIPNGTNPLTILGINTSGYVSWTDTAITSVQIPTGISDSSYTGNIVLTRNDSKSHTYSGFRVLPRITSVDPTQPVKGESVTINGDHLCQVGAASCPTGFNASNKITFYNGADATAFNSWSNTSAVTTVPTAAQSGNLVIRSNDYDSNNFNVTLASTAPNDPDIGPGTNKGQYKSNGITTISIGGGTNETSVVFMASSSASVNINLALQVEVDPIGTPFLGDNIITGATVSFTGTPVIASTTVSGLSTSTFQYHWRARLKNMTTNETSNWVAFGSNPPGDGLTDGSPAATDFYIDNSVEIINVCEVGPTATTCDGSMPSDIQAQIRWETNGGESATKWVRYSNAGGTCPSGSTAADVFNALPNAEPASESSLTSSPLSVVLNGLTASSIYKYKIKSMDSFGNVAYYPSGTACEEFQTATAKNRLMKTLEFYIEQSTTAVNSFDKNFDVFISERSNTENNITFKSIIIEIFGLSKNTGNFNVDVTLNGNLKTYTIADTGGNATYWSAIYNANDINYDYMYDSSANNTLSVSSSASTNTLLGAKAIITYYYVPQ